MAVQATATPIAYVTGQTLPFTSATAMPKTGTMPAAVQLKTSAAVAITASTITGNTDNTWLALSSTDYDKNKFRVGTWLYMQGLVVRIINITNDGSTIQIATAMPSSVSGTNVYYVTTKYKSVRAISSGSAPAILQGVPFKNGLISDSVGTIGVAPISYDASASNAEITFYVTE
jgi:hypothetical protein